MQTGRGRPARSAPLVVAAALALAVGAVLVASTFADNLFEVGPSFEGLPIIWTIIVGGIVILGAGALASVFGRRSWRVADVSVPDAATVWERVRSG